MKKKGKTARAWRRTCVIVVPLAIASLTWEAARTELLLLVGYAYLTFLAVAMEDMNDEG